MVDTFRFNVLIMEMMCFSKKVSKSATARCRHPMLFQFIIRGDFQILDDEGLPKQGSKLENQYIRLGFGLFKDDKEKV